MLPLRHHGKQGRLRARLGEVLAAELLAEAAINTGIHPQSVRVDIGPRAIGRRQDGGMVAEPAGRFLEQRVHIGLLHRRIGIFAGTRPFKRIPLGLDHAFQIAGLAPDAAESLELGIVRLHLAPGDAPILDRQIGVDELLSVALLHRRSELELDLVEAPALAVPMHPGSAHAGAGQESAPAADGQRPVPVAMPQRDGFLGHVLHEGVADGVAHLVMHERSLEIRHCPARPPTLEPEDMQAGCREHLAEKSACPADADGDGIDLLQPRRRHRLLLRVHGFHIHGRDLVVLRQAVGLRGERHPMIFDRVVKGGIGAGEADRAPGDHVLVAAIDRIAEIALDRHVHEMGEEDFRWHAVEIAEPAVLELVADEIVLSLGR